MGQSINKSHFNCSKFTANAFQKSVNFYKLSLLKSIIRTETNISCTPNSELLYYVNYFTGNQKFNAAQKHRE